MVGRAVDCRSLYIRPFYAAEHRCTAAPRRCTKLWYDRSWVPMATKNTSVTLTGHFVEFADRQVREGRYGSTSGVLRAGLRLLEEHEARLANLRAALAEGEASGLDEEFDFDAFIAEVDDQRMDFESHL